MLRHRNYVESLDLDHVISLRNWAYGHPRVYALSAIRMTIVQTLRLSLAPLLASPSFVA